MKKTAIIFWSVLALYLAINIFVGAHPVLKELPHTSSKEENHKILKEWKQSPITHIQKIMLPVWKYNRYIYPSLFVLCLLLTYLSRSKSTDNKSFKPTRKSGAVY